mgnify:CR=1 FL=1
MNTQPLSGDAHCSECGTVIEHQHGDEDRCPACFDKYLFEIDAAFLDNYATTENEGAALALADAATQAAGALIASDAAWLNGTGRGLTPDQVAMFVLDPQRRSLVVQGLTADEGAMARVVAAIDTATRASSNLLFAYLQTKNL